MKTRTFIAEETMYESSVVRHFAEQGIEQGIEQGTVEALLDVLEIRFGLAASEPLADRIGTIDDVQRLKQLHRAAHTGAQPRSLQQPVRRRRVKALRNSVPNSKGRWIPTGARHRDLLQGRS